LDPEELQRRPVGGGDRPLLVRHQDEAVGEAAVEGVGRSLESSEINSK
jgi:hypothetical protein